MSDTQDQPTKNEGESEGADVKVVLEQTLLTCPEVFVYRIPPMMTSGGHRAEDWNLASPLETCSLVVKRVDSSCFLNLMSEKPKVNGPPGATEPHLFAKCHIALDFNDPTKRLEHWVEGVVDSSRYSVIRICDERTGREAHIGMGFRERTDAINFKMSLQEYENALRREHKAQAMHTAYEKTHPDAEGGGSGGVGGDGAAQGGDSLTPPSSGGGPTLPAVGKLTLKEGEKIHVKLKGIVEKDGGGGAKRSSGYGLSGRKAPPPGALVGKGGLLLKKPPPADGAAAAAAAAAATPKIDGSGEESTQAASVVKEGAEAVKQVSGTKPDCETSIAAVAPSDIEGGLDDEDDDDDDDEWGDFEGSSSSVEA